MLSASNGVHFAWYEAAAAFFAAGGLYTAVHARRGGDTTLLLATVLLGLPFYQLAAGMYLASTDDLLGVRHLTCLCAHLTCLAWNFSTVVVVRTWWAGSLRRIHRIVLALPFVASVAVLLGAFAYLYPGPPEQNYLLWIRGSVPGDLYIIAYAFPMLVAKGYVIATGISMIRQLRRTDAMPALLVMVAGSAGIGSYAVCRLLLALGLILPIGNPESWELLPTMAHAAGAICYVAAVVFAAPLSTAHRYVRGALTCLRLNRITLAGRRCFPGLGSCPCLRPADLLTPSRVNQQLVRQVAYLSDVWILLRRRRNRPPVGPEGVEAPVLSDSYEDFHADCARYLVAAGHYRRSGRAGRSAQERLYGALAAA
ncbi:hypothetical protein KO481_26130 [Nocardia sp. NEAU-G5]|uniref:Integral membrane protein n=1 Tax=Nocardia albiluteola TaxID=2842303 RepID=A0ABS6B3X1_9NOCA|nr:hypothetical protein [Nocardia albiluteola]MBU3064997.1 hypothetical protein [Nocardia albiluteola]